MPVEIQDQGTYELFETANRHRILALDDRKWFALIRGQQGDILVHSDATHTRARTLQQGRFYLADFDQDPRFTDMPHLFLEVDGKYAEWVLPNGLSTERDPQKRVVFTDETLSKTELEDYLRQADRAARGARRPT